MLPFDETVQLMTRRLFCESRTAAATPAPSGDRGVVPTVPPSLVRVKTMPSLESFHGMTFSVLPVSRTAVNTPWKLRASDTASADTGPAEALPSRATKVCHR